MKKKLIYLVVMVALAAGGGVWFFLQSGNITSASAVVEGELAHVPSLVPGTVAEVYVRLGENVRQGQPLFALESSGFAAQIARERALLAKLAAALPGGVLVPSPLGNQDLSSAKDLDVLRAEEEEARRAVEAAAHVYGAASVGLTRMGSGTEGEYSPITPKRQAARIARDEAALALQKAREVHEKASYARARREAEDKSMAHSAMNAALAAHIAEYQAQLARVGIAEKSLAAAVVRAPQGGRVIAQGAVAGKSLLAGESLVTLLPDQAGGFWITALFSQKDAQGLVPGQVCLVFTTEGGEGLPGRVEAVAPATAEKGVAVRVILDQNAAPLPVRIGQAVSVTIPVGRGAVVSGLLPGGGKS